MELLEQLKLQGKDSAGWGVCILSVKKICELGLEVVHIPELNDIGHCEIRGEFTRKVPKKLAKISRMLGENEIANGNPKELA